MKHIHTEIVNYILCNPMATQEQIANKFSLSRRTITRNWNEIQTEVIRIQNEKQQRIKEAYIAYELSHIQKSKQVIDAIENVPVEKAIDVLTTAQNNFAQKQIAIIKAESAEKIAALPLEKSKEQSVPEDKSQRLLSCVNSLGANLTPYQKAFDEAPQRFRGVLSSTKAGKTHYCIYALLKEVVVQKQGIFWWVAPTYKVAKIAFRRIMTLMNDFRVVCYPNKSDLEIRFADGQLIQFKTGEKPDNIYGEDVRFCVFDEFTRSSTQAWEAVYSTLTKTDGRAILIGNYTSSANWGVKMVVERGSLDPANWAFFKVTIWQAVEAGIVKRAVAEQAQKDLHPNVFKALYLAEGSFDETQLIKDPDKIPEMFARQLSEKNPEMYISADIAFEGADLFVVCVWRGLTVVEIFTMAKSNSREVIDALQKLSAQYNVPERNLIYDASGLGNFVIGYLPKAQPFVGNVMVGRLYANLRARCYYELSTAISRGQIAIEPKTYSKEIEEELLAMRTRNINGKLGISPKEDIKKILGRSTDFADTLMMRFFYELTKIKHD